VKIAKKKSSTLWPPTRIAQYHNYPCTGWPRLWQKNHAAKYAYHIMIIIFTSLYSAHRYETGGTNRTMVN